MSCFYLYKDINFYLENKVAKSFFSFVYPDSKNSINLSNQFYTWCSASKSV